MVEEIKNAKPIATLSPRALAHGRLEEAKRKFRRCRLESSKQEALREVEIARRNLAAFGGTSEEYN